MYIKRKGYIMFKKLLLLFMFSIVSLQATAPTQDNVAKLYVATFDRAPDTAGLAYWVGSGLTLEHIAKSFFEQPETQSLYPSDTSSKVFVESIYSNLFNRTVDQAGLDYWVEEIDSGNIEKSVFILSVIHGALGDDAIILTNKTTIGLAFANAGYSSVTFAKSIMYGVSGSSASVEEALQSIENKRISTLLKGVKITTWMYQIQGLEERSAIDLLGETTYDMLVVEPGHNFKEFPYDTSYLISKLKQKASGQKRMLLAYIDIGQAEDWRSYWSDDWIAPTTTEPGTPDFLVTIDPDGWSGNYPVAYWDTQWQDIWLGTDGIIKQLATYGFDGVYLDWVEAYDDDKVRELAISQGINPENTMISFIEKIKNIGKSINPDFVIISQNAPYLLDYDPVYYTSVTDAIATEDTWFYGKGDAEWDDPNAGDLSGDERQGDDYSTANRIAQNKKYLNLGIPVFTVDYCISHSNAEMTYANAHNNEFIPLVTRVSLSRITETPPELIH
ncbi:MAG: glycoside hydrolase, end-alpha-1,4-polygalactosaminidase [Epsilonproteobacteria bacterium]|nr:MAG: glycoside hydrolase, end-alpha-1,4-polygalactosaminidase [Campylobacterota bacterium]